METTGAAVDRQQRAAQCRGAGRDVQCQRRLCPEHNRPDRDTKGSAGAGDSPATSGRRQPL